MIRSFVFAVVAAYVLMSAPSAVRAAASCLSADPSAAADGQQLSDVRFAIDAQCPCGNFTGEIGKTRRDWMRCAKTVLKAALANGRLRSQCRGLATYPISRAVCGYLPAAAPIPCLHTSAAGKVTCKIVTPAKCAKAGDVGCASYENCLDAADTNHDHRVGLGDSGACNPPIACLNPPRADGTTCDAGVDERTPRTCNSRSCGPCVPTGTCSVTTSRHCGFDGHCPDGEACVFGSAPRFVDNHDGTITDRQSCLVWEKKGHGTGTPVVCPGGATCNDPHDADNRYAWSSTGTAADGAAFGLIADLNVGAFAGHADWRLPTDLGALSPATAPRELETLADAGATGCGSGAPCTPAAFQTACTASCNITDSTCSCTAVAGHWTATTDATATRAWSVDFTDAQPATADKTQTFAVRAVRGGLFYRNCDALAAQAAVRENQALSACHTFCRNVSECELGCDFLRDGGLDPLRAAEVNACRFEPTATCEASRDATLAYCQQHPTPSPEPGSCALACDGTGFGCANACVGFYDCPAEAQAAYADCVQTNR